MTGCVLGARGLVGAGSAPALGVAAGLFRNDAEQTQNSSPAGSRITHQECACRTSSAPSFSSRQLAVMVNRGNVDHDLGQSAVVRHPASLRVLTAASAPAQDPVSRAHGAA